MSLRLAVVALSVAVALGPAMQPREAVAQDAPSHDAEAEAAPPWFRVGSWRNWIFRSFLQDETNDATTLGLELETYLTLGNLQVKNIAYLEVADHPRPIPGQPQETPTPSSVPTRGSRIS